MATELAPGRRRLTPAAVAADAVLVLWSAFSLLPIAWTLVLALSPADRAAAVVRFLPSFDTVAAVLAREGTALAGADVPRALLTSVLNCGGAVLVSLLVGIPAAYAASRRRHRGSRGLVAQLVSLRFAPELLVAVPLFVVYDRVGLFGTAAGMIWAFQLVTLPLVVLVLRSAFEDLPPELEQAALLDGYTRRRAFAAVALPLAGPGIAAAALLAFILAWNSYLLPLVLGGGGATVAVTGLPGAGASADVTAAAALVAALPPLLLGLTVRRSLARGLSLGSVRG